MKTLVTRLAPVLAATALGLIVVAGGAVRAQDAEGALDACAPPLNLEPVAFAGPVEITFETAQGEVMFNAEIARTPAQTSRGLMWRPEIASDYAMVFDFGAPGPRSMWMKNTCASLDIAFLSEDGRILTIARGTSPFSLRSIATDAPARFVVEFAAGRAAGAGVKPGDRLRVEALPQG